MNTEELLKLLVCPACRNGLQFVESGCEKGFECCHCKTVYPVRDDIPLMLVEEAVPTSEWPKGK